MSSDAKQSGFTVTDRRSFADAGTKPPEEAPTTPAAPAAPAAAPSPPPSVPSSERPTSHETAAFPRVDFHTFILSLGSSALLNLGELERPGAGAPEKDLPMAKHTIDILAMLQEKTRGNVTPAEEKLIESLLYDLRLRYVEAIK
jgi:hypothetical protein